MWLPAKHLLPGSVIWHVAMSQPPPTLRHHPVAAAFQRLFYKTSSDYPALRACALLSPTTLDRLLGVIEQPLLNMREAQRSPPALSIALIAYEDSEKDNPPQRMTRSLYHQPVLLAGRIVASWGGASPRSHTRVLPPCLCSIQWPISLVPSSPTATCLIVGSTLLRGFPSRK
jgi:hypothetical protein